MSAGIAALIAHVSFWALLAYGWFWDELRVRGTGIFLILWITGFYTVSLLPYEGMFPSFVALLDIALVLIIFKGDVRLS